MFKNSKKINLSAFSAFSAFSAVKKSGYFGQILIKDHA
jgi:hypothetical protein